MISPAALVRGTLVAFDATTYTATVMLDGSLAEVVMPVGEWVAKGTLAADDTVAVLLFQATNYENGVIVGPFGGIADLLAITGTPTNGQVPIGHTANGALVLATLTGTANQITVTNGAGSITLSAPQDLHTGASPTFASPKHTGNLISHKGGVDYTGYLYVPLAFASRLTSTSFDGDAFSDTAKTLIDLSAVFGAPAGLKAVALAGAVRDSGSAANDCFLILSDDNTAGAGIAVSPDRSGNDRFGRFEVIVPCDANGDIYYQVEASGAGTFDIFMSIVGYWL